MNCRIIVVDDFKRDAKKLLKKYLSLKDELAAFQEQLLQNPRMGTLIHENVYKIRLSVKSKGKGKSGGLRIITYVLEIEILIEEDSTEQEIIVYLVAIYDKSDMDNISDKDLKNLIDDIHTELDNEDNETQEN